MSPCLPVTMRRHDTCCGHLVAAGCLAAEVDAVDAFDGRFPLAAVAAGLEGADGDAEGEGEKGEEGCVEVHVDGGVCDVGASWLLKKAAVALVG